MSTGKRTATIVMSKINKLLGKIEDPTEELEYSYRKQKDLLIDVKRNLTEVGTSKKQLIAQKSRLENDLPNYDRQAKQCMEKGDENLAKIALHNKVQTMKIINSLDKQITEVTIEEAKLIEASKVLESKIDQLKLEKEALKAQYNAAKASVKINRSLSGLGSEVGNTGQAIEKAKDKTQQMKAESSAIEELTNAGVLSDSLGVRQDPIDRQLSQIDSANAVDNEFRKMKRKELLKKNDLNFFKT